MKQKNLMMVMAGVIFTSASPVFADDISDIKTELAKMRSDYEARIQRLEHRLSEAEVVNK